MGLQEAKKKFLSQYQLSSDFTKSKYESDLTLFFNICEIKELEDLKKFDCDRIEKFYDFAKTKEWSPSTINQRLQIAKIFTNWLREEGIIEKDCLKNIKKIRAVNNVHYTPSTEDCEKILSYIRKHTKQNRLYLMIKLILRSGFRRSEVCNLKIDDFDSENNFIRVNGKGKKIINQPIPEELANELIDYINSERQELLEKYLKIGGKDKGYLFMSCIGEKVNDKKNLENGNPVQSNSLARALKSYANKSGVVFAEKISLHSLRRRAGTQIYEETGDVKLAQEFLRHSNIDTTIKCYVDFNKNKLVSAVQEMYKVNRKSKEEEEYKMFLELQKKYG